MPCKFSIMGNALDKERAVIAGQIYLSNLKIYFHLYDFKKNLCAIPSCFFCFSGALLVAVPNNN
jgi:hypothetical protein